MARGRPPRNPNTTIDFSDDEYIDDAVIGQQNPLGDLGHNVGNRGHDEGQRDHTEIDEWMALYQPAVNVNEFPKIPARPGFSQRWIRVKWKAGGEIDEKNSTNRFLQGWRPQRVNKSDVQFNTLVGTHQGSSEVYTYKEHILMERPTQLNKNARRRQAADTEARKNVEPQDFQDAQRTSSRSVHGLRVDENEMHTVTRKRGSGDDF